MIFAISLTIAYVIYYAVMITRDLYGKKEENKSNEEVFDVSSITEEEALLELYENGKTSDKRYRRLPIQVIKGYKKAVDHMSCLKWYCLIETKLSHNDVIFLIILFL